AGARGGAGGLPAARGSLHERQRGCASPALRPPAVLVLLHGSSLLSPPPSQRRTALIDAWGRAPGSWRRSRSIIVNPARSSSSTICSAGQNCAVATAWSKDS